jgi:putative DNA primase/helicase
MARIGRAPSFGKSNLDSVLSRLKNVRRVRGGWTAVCPAHEDRRPSLSVSVGADGRVLLHCHAGCNVEDVASALGLEMRDLFPERSDAHRERSDTHRKRSDTHQRTTGMSDKEETFDSLGAALFALTKRYGRFSKSWSYLDAFNLLVGVVVRWDGKDGKAIRPVSRAADGRWRIGAMPEPRPLYRLREILAASEGAFVFVVEGEKCADVVASLGFYATTSAGGANAADKTDWSPLRGKNVVILPDNDSAGERYADEVARLCREVGAASIRVLRLADYATGLPAGGDIADVVESSGWCGLPLGDAAGTDDFAKWLFDAAKKIEPLSFSSHTGANATREADNEATREAGAERHDRGAGRHANAGANATRETVTCFADIEPQEVAWLWRERIPLGRLTVLAGRPGVGKSFVTVDFASRVSTGAAWPDGSVNESAGGVLFFAAEDDPADTIRPRLDAAGADSDRVYYCRNVDLVEIESRIDRVPGCRLVVIDPIGSYLGRYVDAYRENEVRAVLEPLAEIASRRGIAVILVAHTRKAWASFADDSVLGSRAFVGLARAVWHVVKDPHDRARRLFLPGKSNLSRETSGLAFWIASNPARVQWLGPVDLQADDLATEEPTRGRKSEARNAAVDWLRTLLRDGAMSVRKIREAAQEAGFSWATVRRAAETLPIEARKKSFDDGWEWRLECEDAHIECEDAHIKEF